MAHLGGFELFFETFWECYVFLDVFFGGLGRFFWAFLRFAAVFGALRAFWVAAREFAQKRCFALCGWGRFVVIRAAFLVLFGRCNA